MSTKVRIPIQKGGLAQHDKNGKIVQNYHISEPESVRRALLDKIVKRKRGGAYALHKALVVRRTLGKNRLSEFQKSVLTGDMVYLKNKYHGTTKWTLGNSQVSKKTIVKPVKKSKVSKSKSNQKKKQDRYVAKSEDSSSSESDSDSDSDSDS